MSANYKSDVEAVQDLVSKYNQLRTEIGKVIIGQDEVVRMYSSLYLVVAIVYWSVYPDWQKLSW